MHISNKLECLDKNIYIIYNKLPIYDGLWVKMSEALEKELFKKYLQQVSNLFSPFLKMIFDEDRLLIDTQPWK